MKNDDIVKPGEKIEIEIEEDSCTNQYLSKVEEVIDDNTFVIAKPMGEDYYTYLSLGQVIRVIYSRKDALYYFDAEVIERLKSQENISAKLTIISDKYKLQRRNYYRLEIMVPVTLVFEIKQQENTIKTIKKIDTVDISGGGIKILSDNKMDMDTELDLLLSIPDIEYEPVKGRVIRSILVEGENPMYESAIEFIDIDPKVRQSIIRYIFSKQRELIKKGFK